jgi:aspartate aminotransferase
LRPVRRPREDPLPESTRAQPSRTDHSTRIGAFVSAQLSHFARSLSVETAFTVLALARSLKAAGKDVVELEIGDSPFDSTASARAGGMDAIKNNQSHYCPSPGIPEFREAAAKFVREEFDIPAQASNIVAGAGAKVFQQFFCEAFLNPGDGVLVFSPYFPTFVPNIERRGARAVLAPLKQANGFRPAVSDIERFLKEDPSPRAIFLNSPHNPTGGVATQDDLKRIADVAAVTSPCSATSRIATWSGAAVTTRS